MPPTAELAVPAARARLGLARVVFALAGLFLWSLVLQAPLRYGLAQLHLDALIYLPKLLLVAAVMLLPVLRPRVSLPALSLTGLAGLYLLWGAANLPSPTQALFGLWVMVPLLFGLWAGPMVQVGQWRRLFVLLFLTAAVGVFLNPLVSYPWSGQSLSLLGKSIEVSRQWSAFGVQRYAGFARASFSAAAQLLLFGLMLVALLRRTSAKLLVWLVAGAGIALTTSKGPFGAWLILSLYFLGGRVLGWPRYWVRIWVGFLGLSLLAMMLLPLSTLWIHYDPTLQGFTSRFLFASFGDRLNSDVAGFPAPARSRRRLALVGWARSGRHRCGAAVFRACQLFAWRQSVRLCHRHYRSPGIAILVRRAVVAGRPAQPARRCHGLALSGDPGAGHVWRCGERAGGQSAGVLLGGGASGAQPEEGAECTGVARGMPPLFS